MSESREEICSRAARALEDAAAGLKETKAVVGFDGFVDEIIAVVDKRYSVEAYNPVRTISALAEKIRAAAGESSNYELVIKQRKLGGNGPIMANALASLGLDVSYIGSLGHPLIDPVFHDFATRARVVSIAEPGHTDALEFEDGKLMLGKYGWLNDVDWRNLVERVGRPRLESMIGEATLIGMVNWTMLPNLSAIWERLLDEVFPALPASGRRFLFVDLADPEKRTPEDILGALKLLTLFQARLDVVLGLNLKESIEIASVLGMPPLDDPEAGIEAAAAEIRSRLGLSCVVIHPRRSAAAATAERSARFEGPFVDRPLISTGAGDHFNAGFCLGKVLGLDLPASLCSGVATSGYYVRTARSPSILQLSEFVGELPAPLR